MVCALLTPRVSATPGAGDISVSGTFGFGGYFKVQIPAPLRITVANSGEMFDGWALANLEAWIPPTYYTRPLAIPPGGQQQLEFGCFGCVQGAQCEVPVDVYTSDGRLIEEAILPSYRLRDFDSLLVHLGDPGTPLGNIFIGDNPGYLIMAEMAPLFPPAMVGYPPRVFPVVLDPKELPSSVILMQGVSLVATNLEGYLSLDQATKDTLLGYVRHGGNLLVYHRDGVDRMDGWESEPLLPVVPSSGRRSVPLAAILDACDAVTPYDALQMEFSPATQSLDRGVRGEILARLDVTGESSLEVTEDSGDDPLEVADSPWSPPRAYPIIGVSPVVQCETVTAGDSREPILVVRKLGSGHAGFAAFNPFLGAPTAGDPPIILLATFGLLDPYCPSRDFSARAVSTFRSLADGPVQAFFAQGVTVGRSWIMRWLVALGPALVFLAVLPLIALLTRGRGRVALALFAAWALIVTGVTLYSRAAPASGHVIINEANLYWCEALLPEEGEMASVGATLLYTFLTYGATTPTRRTPSFHAPGALLDEYVNPAVWPYGAVTIEEGPVTRAPDLPLEVRAFSGRGVGQREFIYRRPAPEMTASGKLEIGGDYAHFTLDAVLPFPVVASRLGLTDHGIWIGKNLGEQSERVQLDFDLIEGVEITRPPESSPDSLAPLIREQIGEPAEVPQRRMGYPLQRLWDLTFSMPVRAGHSYSQSRITGRPRQAFVMLASTGIPTDVSIDRGTLERHAVTVMVITVPIVYVD